MVAFKGTPLDLVVGDIVVERQLSHVIGEQPLIRYWVISKVIENDNPIRYGHTYNKSYCAFNLEDEMDTIERIVFRNESNWEYTVIHYG